MSLCDAADGGAAAATPVSIDVCFCRNGNMPANEERRAAVAPGSRASATGVCVEVGVQLHCVAAPARDASGQALLFLH